MRFAIENLLVSIGLWALQHYRQASIYKTTGINSTINPLVVRAQLKGNEFAGDMF